MSNEFKPLEEEEVIRFDYEPIGKDLGIKLGALYDKTYFLEIPILNSQLKTAITDKISISSETKNELLEEGINCEVMKFNSKGWRKGKLKMRIVFEFCPDEPEISEPESPLDEMRKALEKNS